MSTSRAFSKTAMCCVLGLAITSGTTAQDSAGERMDVAPETGPDVAERVVGGVAVGSKAWPATRISITTIGGKKFMCTATIIGPRVVLTAAHCVNDKTTMQIAIAGGTATVRCNHHDSYAPANNFRNDIALCLASTNLTLPPLERYERLNVTPSLPSTNASVILLGFGCTSKDPDSKTSGYLHQGPSTVAYKMDNRINMGNGAVLCEGDSGGAAYLQVGDRRSVIGVNSTRAGDFSYSNVTNVAAPEIATFIASWSEANAAPICGYTAPATVCRN